MTDKQKPRERQVIGRGYEPGKFDLAKLPPVKDAGPGAGAAKERPESNEDD